MSVNHLLILLLGLPTTNVYKSFFYFYDDAAGIKYTLLIVMFWQPMESPRLVSYLPWVCFWYLRCPGDVNLDGQGPQQAGKVYHGLHHHDASAYVNSSNLMWVLRLHYYLIDVNFYYFMEVLSIDYNLKKVDLFLFEEQKPQCLECY